MSRRAPGITPVDFVKNPAIAGCPNQQNIVNSRSDPGNTGELIALSPVQTIPIQVTRLDAIGNNTDQKSVPELNALFRSCWQPLGRRFSTM